MEATIVRVAIIVKGSLFVFAANVGIVGHRDAASAKLILDTVAYIRRATVERLSLHGHCRENGRFEIRIDER